MEQKKGAYLLISPNEPPAFVYIRPHYFPEDAGAVIGCERVDVVRGLDGEYKVIGLALDGKNNLKAAGELNEFASILYHEFGAEIRGKVIVLNCEMNPSGGWDMNPPTEKQVDSIFRLWGVYSAIEKSGVWDSIPDINLENGRELRIDREDEEDGEQNNPEDA